MANQQQADDALPITPNDSADIPGGVRGIYVGNAGDVRVMMLRGSSPVTFAAVTVSTFLPIRVTRVYATGTTATNLLALY